MCSKTETMKSTIACWDNIVRLKRELDSGHSGDRCWSGPFRLGGLYLRHTHVHESYGGRHLYRGCGGYTAARRYEDFLRRHEGQHILFWALGVGGNTPVIIKYLFWRMTHQSPKATYACISLSEAYYRPKEIQKQAICID